ncbi:hypothetical protein [Streptosporangium sp. NPDC051022]
MRTADTIPDLTGSTTMVTGADNGIGPPTVLRPAGAGIPTPRDTDRG